MEAPNANIDSFVGNIINFKRHDVALPSDKFSIKFVRIKIFNTYYSSFL